MKCSNKGHVPCRACVALVMKTCLLQAFYVTALSDGLSDNYIRRFDTARAARQPGTVNATTSYEGSENVSVAIAEMPNGDLVIVTRESDATSAEGVLLEGHKPS